MLDNQILNYVHKDTHVSTELQDSNLKGLLFASSSSTKRKAKNLHVQDQAYNKLFKSFFYHKYRE